MEGQKRQKKNVKGLYRKKGDGTKTKGGGESQPSIIIFSASPFPLLKVDLPTAPHGSCLSSLDANCMSLSCSVKEFDLARACTEKDEGKKG